MKENRHLWDNFDDWHRDNHVKTERQTGGRVNILVDGVLFANVLPERVHETKREIFEYFQRDEHASWINTESYDPSESWCDTTNQFTR